MEWIAPILINHYGIICKLSNKIYENKLKTTLFICNNCLEIHELSKNHYKNGLCNNCNNHDRFIADIRF